jgi:hypothetical protein
MRKLLTVLVLLSLMFVRLPARQGTTVLQASDFTYLNCYYDVQTNGSDTTYSQGLTFRYVNGDLRFISRSLDSRFEEFSIAGSNCGDAITTMTNTWDFSGYPQLKKSFNSYWWDAPNNRLWLTPGEDYTNVYYPSETWTVQLPNSGGAPTNVHGPVYLDVIPTKRTYGGAAAVPAAFQSTYNVGPYVIGFGGYTSLVAQGGGASLGLTMYSVPDPANTANGGTLNAGSNPGAQYRVIADHIGATGSTDWYSSGTPSSFDRGQRLTNPINYYDGGDSRQNPSTAPTVPPLPGAAWLSPAPDGKGRFVWGDTYFNTGMWISGPRSGFVAVASLCQGKCYYATSTLVSDARVAEIHVFSEAMLGAAVQGSVKPWNVQPATFKTLSLPGMGSIGLEGNQEPGNIGGAVYDPATHHMYLICYGCGQTIYYGRIYVFDVNTGGTTTPPPAPPLDTTPPTVAIVSPAANATVSGASVALTATASDNVGVTSVQYTVDGTSVGSATSAPYSVTWNSTTVSSGTHTIQAIAADAAGNIASAVESITVGSGCTAGTPTVSLSPNSTLMTSPGQPVSSTLTVQNNDAAGCPTTTFALGDVVPSGWSAAYATPSLGLSPGSAGTAGLSLTPPLTANGVSNFTGTAARKNTQGPGGSVAGTVMVTTAPLNVSLSTMLSNNTAQLVVQVGSSSIPVSGASVTFTVLDPTGKGTAFSATTNGAGTATDKYQLKGKNSKGQVFQVQVVATSGGLRGSASGSFTTQ